MPADKSSYEASDRVLARVADRAAAQAGSDVKVRLVLQLAEVMRWDRSILDWDEMLEHIRVISATDKQHVVEFRDDGWAITHPLTCRPALFDCSVYKAAAKNLPTPPLQRGRYEIELRDGELIVGKPVAAEGRQQ